MNDTKEVIIKPIPGYEGYFASTNGKIYSNKRYGELRELKASKTTTSNYLVIKLSENGKRHHCLVHRLVALTFIPNPNNLPEVNHKDKDVSNCRVDNLEWCTRKDNLNDSYSTKSPTRNYRIAKLYKNDEFIGKFQGIVKAARYASNKYGASFSSLNKYLRSGDFRITYEGEQTRTNYDYRELKQRNKKDIKVYKNGYKIGTFHTFVEVANFFTDELNIPVKEKTLNLYCLKGAIFKNVYTIKRE